MDGGLACLHPFLEFQPRLEDLEAQALDLARLLPGLVRRLAADGAASGADRSLFRVVVGALDELVLADPPTLEVLEVGALALLVRGGVGVPAFGIGESRDRLVEREFAVGMGEDPSSPRTLSSLFT